MELESEYFKLRIFTFAVVGTFLNDEADFHEWFPVIFMLFFMNNDAKAVLTFLLRIGFPVSCAEILLNYRFFQVFC